MTVLRSRPTAKVDNRRRPVVVVAWLVAAVVFVGLIANQNVAELLSQGRRLDLSESTVSIWQFVREGLLVVLAGYLLLFVAREKRRRTGKVTVSPWVVLVLVFVGAQLVRALLDTDIPDTVALIGLRFLYVASIAASIRWFDPDQRAMLLRILARLLIVFFVIEATIAAGQIINGPSTLGVTVFGSRPWGTYASSNNLGLSFVGIALILALSRVKWRWFWLIACAGMTLTTGSRTAILSVLLIFVGMAVAHWKHRLLLVPIGAIGFYAVYILTSTQAVSGRNIDEEGRLDLWASSLAVLDGPGTFIFGQGLGYASNAATTALGKLSLTGSVVVSDSTIVATMLSMGLLGVVIFAAAFITAAARTEYARRYMVFGPLLLIAFSFNVAELSPVNVLLAVAVGVSLRQVTTSSRPSAVRL